MQVSYPMQHKDSDWAPGETGWSVGGHSLGLGLLRMRAISMSEV